MEISFRRRQMGIRFSISEIQIVDEKVQEILSEMEKRVVNPTTILLCAVVICLLNSTVFGQSGQSPSEFIESIKLVAQILGYVFLVILAVVNVWYAIKNKNTAQLKEDLTINKSLVDSQKDYIRQLESDKATLTTRKNELKLENIDLEKENKDLKKLDLRSKERE